MVASSKYVDDEEVNKELKEFSAVAEVSMLLLLLSVGMIEGSTLTPTTLLFCMGEKGSSVSEKGSRAPAAPPLQLLDGGGGSSGVILS